MAVRGKPVRRLRTICAVERQWGLIGAAYGATFAIITVALISGAIADRAKFGAWMIFAGIWATLVYFPVAAWVWGGGWIMNLGDLLGGLPGVIDYAGGTAVHIKSAGLGGYKDPMILMNEIGMQGSRMDEISRTYDHLNAGRSVRLKD